MSVLNYKISRDEWLKKVENRSKSSNTKDVYEIGLNHWDEFLQSINRTDSEIIDELRTKNNDTQTYVFLDRFIQYLSERNLKKTSIDLYFAALRSWCASNGVMLFNEYVNKFINKPKQNVEMREPLTEDMVRQLVENADDIMECILLILVSSGMRIGECLHLKVSDITPLTPTEVKISAATTKSRIQRKTYISDEAMAKLIPLMSTKNPDEYIFVDKWRKNTLRSFEVRFGRLRKRCGLLKKYDDNRHYHVNIHAFRSFFFTKAVKAVGSDNAHALIGHKQYLDQYFRLEDGEKAKLYHNIEPFVTVSNFGSGQPT